MQVRAAFAESTQLIWRVMIGVSAAGLLTCMLMREVPLRTDMDETWGLQEKGSAEKVVVELEPRPEASEPGVGSAV